MQILGLLLLKVLQAQNEMLAPAILGISAFLLNIGTNFIFIRAYGFLGAPIATTVSRVLFFVGSVAILAHSVYCRGKQRDEGGSLITCSSSGKVKPCYTLMSLADDEETHPHLAYQEANVPDSPSLTAALIATCKDHDGSGSGVEEHAQCAQFSSVPWQQAWQQSIRWTSIQSYLKLAIPGGLMVAMEYGSFDVTTMFAGTLGVAQVLLAPALLLYSSLASCCGLQTYLLVRLLLQMERCCRVARMLAMHKDVLFLLLQLRGRAAWCRWMLM
jgi:hypothetical protein